MAVAAAVIPAAHGQDTRRVHRLQDAMVWGRRPMKEIGVQKTAIDSAALKENVALSMADILTFNSSVFVKSHGRATLSTVTFRGTSPGHTQVTWNGMRINTPMLGMTDFCFTARRRSTRAAEDSADLSVSAPWPTSRRDPASNTCRA